MTPRRLSANVMRTLAPPEMSVLTEAEIAALSAAYAELEREAPDRDRPWRRLARMITFVGLGTTLRRGKLLALRWRDVHMLEGLLYVRQALVAEKFTTPKSRSSRPTIELGPRTRALLQEHWQVSGHFPEPARQWSEPGLTAGSSRRTVGGGNLLAKRVGGDSSPPNPD